MKYAKDQSWARCAAEIMDRRRHRRRQDVPLHRARPQRALLPAGQQVFVVSSKGGVYSGDSFGIELGFGITMPVAAPDESQTVSADSSSGIHERARDPSKAKRSYSDASAIED
jgi:hypothetical protein